MVAWISFLTHSLGVLACIQAPTPLLGAYRPFLLLLCVLMQALRVRTGTDIHLEDTVRESEHLRPQQEGGGIVSLTPGGTGHGSCGVRGQWPSAASSFHLRPQRNYGLARHFPVLPVNIKRLTSPHLAYGFERWPQTKRSYLYVVL